MASSEFEFVQGNERLDWGVLVSIDVERLMKSTSVETLQRIIENIAFSRVTRDEAALFTAEHILHLFQLCQVVIQYLVYSQEVLAKMNVRLNDRMAAQQAAVQEREVMLQRLSEENSSLKKQVKTQRRTLLAYEYNAQAALARGGGGGAPTAPAYACPYCGEVYQKAESMQSHLRKRHNTSSSAAAAPSVPSAWSDGAGLPVPAAVSSPSPPPPAPTSYAQLPQQSYYQPPPPQVSSAEELAALPQLRHRVEQLEKDKEVMERQQRENLILMMLGATRSQPTTTPPPPPPPSPAAAPATASALPSAFAPSPSSSPLPGLASSSPASPSLAEQLQGIPVVPDVSAMMNYNLSCQRESSENALRRQLVDLEAEIRALRTSNAAAVAPGTTTPAAAAAGTEPTVPRPPWVAELQQAQHPTTTITTPSLTPVPVVPALSVPASPPPTPLPPAPASAAVPPTHAYDYTSGITVNVPAPISPPQLPSPLSGLQAPPVMSPLPPPAPSVAAAETPLSVPRFDTQQQQQPPAPLSSLLPRPVPLPRCPRQQLPPTTAAAAAARHGGGGRTVYPGEEEARPRDGAPLGE
ncbi:hypothetical protein ABB37_07114 [Leptomonas pyrrhocoris]|uniref:C2H2-type domain-containing protein n=1 Tax=Leptomonas pyrrhocoris TaxID=157538 RepID=A0A0M9FVY6_LEPPY|nr:hypothetical protein ABB37_07114 [Leptomonas pyrrhocoris]XP_015655640.1 hypothetical protein ABB37_07114 [Leptomonas pyrrhocoris]KPA77200.1 hypothetical protein ABB37_07114 [Leptomonas pyrrhocoris]KPA77201.1 hypothetical protein ABB37_07114 [Leptomonas pyrrhocoris]|eukprot:XP_015655639.1 hypothetical protein ABB37_07114 [Leptomonas pyrrhocoris]